MAWPPPVLAQPASHYQLSTAINDIMGALIGPWTDLAPGAAGVTGTPKCRREGGSTQLGGQVSGTLTNGTNIGTVPAGLRAIFPPGFSHSTFLCPSIVSNTSGYITVRVWGDGALIINGVSGTPPTSVDLTPIRFPSTVSRTLLEVLGRELPGAELGKPE